MAQARRKKTTPAINLSFLRYVKRGLRESAFLIFAGIALYLMVVLISFDPSDPAWSHTGDRETINNPGGLMGAWFADIAFYFFGYLAYAFPLAIAFCGWSLFKRNGLSELDAEVVIFRFLGLLVGLGAGCGLASLHLHNPHELVASGGGVVGDFIGQGLIAAFDYAGGNLFLLILFLAGFTLATGLSWVAVMDLLGKITLEATARSVKLSGAIRVWVTEAVPQAEEAEAVVEPKSVQRREPMIETQERLDVRPPLRIEPVLAVSAGEDIAPQPPLAVPPEEAIAPQPPPKFKPKPVAVEPRSEQRTKVPASAAQDSLPPLDLLNEAESGQRGYSSEVLEDMSRRLETLLRHFGVEVQVVAVEPGPVITRFELDPAPGVKVSQISNLAKDLARGLSVVSVRVVEVVPGKSVVGLEIPNRERETVYLRELLDSSAYSKSASPLSLALGKDIGGNPVVANLARMPHLLVAGTTGSGKSVFINAMLLSLLYKARSEEVRLILVDPKMLELSIYEGIPHLLAPVVTDMKDAANALRWCVAEMERRYRLMAALKVRNIAAFNRLVGEAIEAGEPISDPLYKPEEDLGEEDAPPTLERLPFIVVVVDELADMMMMVGKKVEELIARLAQKARASGIHLILATQRPSVDVITGLIKANIPTRIAFQVSSKIDSRTILDQMGAEQLLGHGDMLYLPPGSGFPQRLHGAFVDDHEVNDVVEYLKQTGQPEYMEDILEEPVEGAGSIFTAEGIAGNEDAESDPLYDQAVRIVTESRRASISGVQRRLRIGYNRAARLVEDMESAGVVGPLQPNGNREVLAPPPPDV